MNDEPAYNITHQECLGVGTRGEGVGLLVREQQLQPASSLRAHCLSLDGLLVVSSLPGKHIYPVASLSVLSVCHHIEPFLRAHEKVNYSAIPSSSSELTPIPSLRRRTPIAYHQPTDPPQHGWHSNLRCLSWSG